MELTQLRYFMELKKHEHFSITADYLNISQPALSRSISTLENELGVKLFDRIGKQVRLNEQGAKFAVYCEQALNALETGAFVAKNSHYDTVGHISIQCYAFAPILSSCITEYTKLNPAATFSVSQATLGERLKQSNHPDFILRSALSNRALGQKENFWTTEPLFREKYVLAVAKEDPRFPKDKSSISIGELKQIPFVTMLQNNIFFQDITFSLCQEAGFYPRIYGQTDTIFFKLHAVQEGLAVAILPESSFLSDMYSGVRTLELENCNTVRTVYLSRQNSAIATEVALDFWNFALDYFNSDEMR